MNQPPPPDHRKQDYPLRFRLANKLYASNFTAYRQLYFFYKRVSERKTISSICNVVKPGMTVADIGGNIGFYTVLLSRLAGAEGRVHTFEPEAVNFAHLQAQAGHLPNVVLNRMAVGEFSGKKQLFVSSEMNVDHQTYDIGEGRLPVEVKCTSIDDYLSREETLDFIKLDIQGYDYYAVAGMRETLARSERVTLVGEFWPYGLLAAGVQPSAYLSLLSELGFRVEMENGVSGTVASGRTSDKLFYTTFWAVKR